MQLEIYKSSEMGTIVFYGEQREGNSLVMNGGEIRKILDFIDLFFIF